MDDLISRQAAIDALGEEPEVWLDTDVEIAQRAQWRTDKAAIEAVPTAGCEYWDTESNYCALYRPAAVPTAEPERKIELDLDGAETQIEILSALRTQFNCFDEAEEPVDRKSVV